MKKHFAAIIGVLALTAAVASGQSIAAKPGVVPANVQALTSQIVMLRAEADGDGLLSEFGLSPSHRYRLIFNGFAALMDSTTITRLKQDSRVMTVEADGHMILYDQTNGAGIIRMALTNFPVRHANGGDHRISVDVAVLDTGVAWDHPDLNVVDATDFSYCGGWNGYDWDGHGTHVAGIIGALDNGFGVVGVTPGVNIWSLQVIGPGTCNNWSNFLGGMEYIAENASYISVANASLGSDGVTPTPFVAIRQAVQNVVNHGIVFVTAAGNHTNDVYGSDGIYGTADDFQPAAVPEAMDVSAMDTQSNRIASFSNYSKTNAGLQSVVTSPGKAIDLAAPGVNILSTYVDPNDNYALGYATDSGTSMAAAHVSGLVALYIAANGRATNAQGVYRIRQALINSGQPQSAWGVTNTYDPDGNPEPLAYPWANNGNEAWVPVPMISSYSKTQGGFNVSFQAVPGYDYTVQYAPSLTTSNTWTNVPVVAQSLNFIANTGAFGDPAPGDTNKTCKVIFLLGPTQMTNSCADNGTINIGDGIHSITVLNAVYGSTNGLFDVTSKVQGWVVTLGTGNGTVASVTITDRTSAPPRFYRLVRQPTP